MKAESYLFGGVAVFFLTTGVGYGWWSGREPAGTAALTVAFIMSSLICFLFAAQLPAPRRQAGGPTPAEIAERAGPVDFFPARSPYPVLTATGAAVGCPRHRLRTVAVHPGLRRAGAGVGGLAFQYVHRGE